MHRIWYIRHWHLSLVTYHAENQLILVAGKMISASLPFPLNSFLRKFCMFSQRASYCSQRNKIQSNLVAFKQQKEQDEYWQTNNWNVTLSVYTGLIVIATIDARFYSPCDLLGFPLHNYWCHDIYWTVYQKWMWSKKRHGGPRRDIHILMLPQGQSGDTKVSLLSVKKSPFSD